MKIIPSIFTILAISLLPLTVMQAQTDPVGQWKVYPTFSSPATKLVETPETVYGVSGGNLFSYNFINDERRTLNVDNLLSDYEVEDIYYNHIGKYTAVVYSNSNIDLLYDDGRVINMPDIKVAQGISGSRGVNHLNFSEGHMYAATDFGVVVFDDNRYEVERSGNYGEEVKSACELGDKIFILKDDTVYQAQKDGLINRLDRFSPVFHGSGLSKIYPFNSNSLLVYGSSGLFREILSSDLTSSVERKKYTIGDSKFNEPVIIDDNNFNVECGVTLCNINSDGVLKQLATLPESIQDQIYSYNKGIDNLWALDKYGLGQYSLSGSSSLTVKKDKYLPETMSVKTVAGIIPSADGERIYFTNLGPTIYRLSTSGEGKNSPQQTSRLVNGKFEDIAPYPIKAKSSTGKAYQGSRYKWLVSTTTLVEDPDDSDTYFLGTSVDGLYRITNGEESGHFNEKNSPLVPITALGNSTRVFDTGIDRGGNLWVVTQRQSNHPEDPVVMILPAEKRREETSKIKPSDWYVVPVDPTERGSREPRTLFCKKSNMVFIAMYGLLAIDTRGTYNDFSDDIVTYHDNFTDQDGKAFNYAVILSLEEDHDGRIWVGTDAGVFEISNPAHANSSSMVINHIKIPHNDGTNTAEYLLPSERIYGISTDNANRKWIATRSSGLFLVSQRGDKILQNFTSDNSILPDNMINDVYADPRDNRVWIATCQGLISYSSDASPVRDDFSDIYAYPNPVRPDYTGPITIVGLMDNSLVKITDAAGMIINQIKSEGGMARWDGCNMRGERVRSGVYYVFASSGTGDMAASGAVTKILVVN